MKSIKIFIVFLATSLSGIASANLPDFTQVVEKVRDSVVVIATEVESRGRTAPGPSGSGFIIGEEGYVLTNRHVINGVDSIWVQLVNKKMYRAELLGDDAGTDIALLKIEADDLKPVSTGRVDRLKVGSWVMAYGAPFGLEHTVTAGIVSAKDRAIGREIYVPFIQTDAAVNRGNSGGPLFNQNGEVVGINSQIFSMSGGNIGLSFAIPIDLAMDVSNQLRETGSVERGFLGVGFEEVTFDKAQAFGLEEVRGALINSVSPNSPAEDAGIQVGDIVVEVEGRPIMAYTDLPVIVGQIRPGTEIELSVVRGGGKTTELEVTVGERGGTVASASSQTARSLGLEVVELSETMQDELEVGYGVLVRRVGPGAAREAGIRDGDVLQMLNQQAISSLDDYQQAIAQLPEQGSVAVLVVRRGYGPRFLVLKLGDD